MSAELKKLAEDISLRGYSTGGLILSDMADILREAELIPDSLGTIDGPLAKGRKFGPRDFPIDADVLRRLRTEGNVSQKRLARISVLSISTISGIERGLTNKISEETASRLARGLGIQVDVFRREDPITNER